MNINGSPLSSFVCLIISIIQINIYAKQADSGVKNKLLLTSKERGRKRDQSGVWD